MSSYTTSSSGKREEYCEATASVTISCFSSSQRTYSPAHTLSVVLKAIHLRRCSQCFSRMTTTTKWSPPSRKKNKTSSRHSWQQKMPALNQKEKAARNSPHCFFRSVLGTLVLSFFFIFSSISSKFSCTSSASTFAYRCVCLMSLCPSICCTF